MPISPDHHLAPLYDEGHIVAYANHLLEKQGVDLKVTGVQDHGDCWLKFAAVGPRGGRVEIAAPFAQFAVGVIAFRSLLKIDPRARRVTWSLNGQSSKGTSELAFYGEAGPKLKSTEDRVRDYYKGLYAKSTAAPEEISKVVDKMMHRSAEHRLAEVVSIVDGPNIVAMEVAAAPAP